MSAAAEGIWITDRALNHALERYFSVSQVVMSRRRASSVPGPMEARRRLGKRQMTDVFQMHPSPPSWAFEFPMDLTKWRWEPPTPSLFASFAGGDPGAAPICAGSHNEPPDKISRRSSRYIESIRTPFTAPAVASTSQAAVSDLPGRNWQLPNSYEGSRIWSADTQPDDPSAEASGWQEEMNNALSRAVHQDGPLSGGQMTKIDRACPATVFVEEVQGLESLAPTTSPNVFSDKVKTSASTFSDYMRLRLLSTVEIRAIFESFVKALSRFCEGAHKPGLHARDLAIDTYSLLVRGVLGNPVLLETPASELDGLWDPILEGLSRIHGQNTPLCHVLFAEIMMAPGRKRESRVSTVIRQLAKMSIEELEKRDAATMKRNDAAVHWRSRLQSVSAQRRPQRQDHGVAELLIQTACHVMEFYSVKLAAMTEIKGESTESLLRLADESSKSLRICARALSRAQVGLLSSLDDFQSWMVGQALGGCDKGSADRILCAMESAIGAHIKTHPQGSQVALREWCVSLSHMPQIRQRYLLRAVANVESLCSRLSTAEICILMLNKWYSQGKLSTSALSFVERRLGTGRGIGPLGSLLEAVVLPEKSKRGKTLGYYKSIWAVLRATGREKELLPCLERLRKKGRALDDECIKLLAHAVSTGDVPDATLGMEIRGMTLGVDQIEASKARQDSTPGEVEVMEKLLEAESPGAVWESLGVPLEGRRRCARISSRKAALVAKVSVMLSEAGHLNNQQAFRYVNRCVLVLLRDGRHNEELSVAVLSLFRVATRGLASGLKANPSRLAWLTHLVARLEGRDAGEAVRQALLQWIRENDREWRDSMRTSVM